MGRKEDGNYSMLEGLGSRALIIRTVKIAWNRVTMPWTTGSI